MLRIALAVTLAGLAAAQVPQGGSPASFEQQLDQPFTLTVEPTEDIDALIAEDNSNKTRKDELGGFRVGVVVDVNTGLDRFTEDKLADGTIIFRMTITSPSALGMGINFAKFQLPTGVSLFAYNADRTVVRGSFTEWNHKPNGEFAVAPVPGDSITVEVLVPSDAAVEMPVVEVASVVHHYRPTRLTRSLTVETAEARVRRGFRDSGSCNINVACPDASAYQTNAAGVAMILTGSGSRLCSGSMINNAEQDGKQYFLTANHCGTGSAANWIIVFNYQSSGCETPNTEPSTSDSVQGTRLLAQNGASDFGLLELIEKIPDRYNVVLNGFDANDDFEFKEPFSISHPSGDIKKAAYFGGMATPEGYFSPGDTHWLIAEWDWGVTEGGSSGSPILDTMGRIRGQLHGGYAACTYLYIDYYGRISKSWDLASGNTARLDAWLDPQRTGTKVVDSMKLSDARANAQRKINKGTIAH